MKWFLKIVSDSVALKQAKSVLAYWQLVMGHWWPLT